MVFWIIATLCAFFVKVICGAAVAVVGLEMMLRELSDKKATGSRIFLVMIGIASGILCGLYGIGALLGAYLGRITDDTKTFKANICLVFIIENTFRIILYGINGIITRESLIRVALLLPFMIMGLGGGMLSTKYINDRVAKKIVVVLLILSGISLVIANI